MDHKRELTSVDVAAVAGELRASDGAAFRKAYLYPERDLLRLKLRDPEEGRLELLVEVGDRKRAHLAAPDRVPDAPERPPNFAKMLRNRLQGSRLVDVEQFAFDRVLSFTFERENDSTTVVAELFGEGNLAVLDGAGDVIDCLRTVRLKSRTVAAGTQFEYPEARFDPLSADEDVFATRIRQSEADLVRTIATQLNFGGTWGEELCTRAGLPYEMAVDDLTDDQVANLHRIVDELATRLREGDLDPRLYYDEGSRADGEEDDEDDTRPVDVTPVPLAEYEHLRAEPVETFNAGLDAYFAVLDRTPEASGRGGPDFADEIEKRKRIVAQQEGAIEDFERQAERERERAELVYARYDLVDEILSTVQAARDDGVPWDEIAARFEEGAERAIPAAEAVQNVDGSQGTVTLSIDDETITLDASMGVEHNADRLYTEAKRIEEKKAGAEEAVAETREELASLEERREEWEAKDGGGEAEADEPGERNGDDAIDWLARESIPIRRDEQWYEDFRWFHTTNGFLVIGGRNADQNEQIVAKYLDKGDRFLHAQAHGGPATVLKATGPSEPARDVDVPDQDIEEAAQFAVSYSSVWKDGRFAGDAYAVDHDQVSKTAESGEYLEKGGFAIRGEREYFRDVAVGVAVGITCEPETRVIGGPPSAIGPRAVTSVELEPGRYAQNDVAKRVYRALKDRFVDDTFVRKVASPDLIQEFLPPGGSTIVE